MPPASLTHKKRGSPYRLPLRKKGLKLGQFLQLRLDGGEVWQVTGAFQDFGVLNHAGLVNDEGGTLWHAAHDQVFGWQEALISDAVGFSDLVIVVAEELQRDALFFSPGLLCEGIITADADDFGIQGGVGIDAFRKFAELSGASAGEGHRHEQKKNVGSADVFGQLEKLRAIGAEGGDGEIRGGRADRECHGGDIGLNSKAPEPGAPHRNAAGSGGQAQELEFDFEHWRLFSGHS